MKVFTLSVFVIVLFLNASCTSVSSSADLIGTWHTAQNEQIKSIFKSNNTYEVDLDGDGNTEVKGVYSVHGSRVAISDLKGTQACSGELIGIYRYEINDDTLIFTLIEDGCEDRKNSTGSKWIKLASRRTAME